jgi:hypothetical protein
MTVMGKHGICMRGRWVGELQALQGQGQLTSKECGNTQLYFPSQLLQDLLFLV